MSAKNGDNGGPPIDEDEGHVPPWGRGGIGNYFEWSAAKDKAFNKIPADIAIMRANRAEKLGLTYQEYSLEILERGRHLQASDRERIAEIIAKRGVRY